MGMVVPAFSLGYSKSSSHRLGATCKPMFRIVQNERDLPLLECIVNSLGCGSIYSLGPDAYTLNVANLKEITLIIVPFFSTHTLQGAKALDFRDFCLGIDILNSDGHLTEAGLNKLKL